MFLKIKTDSGKVSLVNIDKIISVDEKYFANEKEKGCFLCVQDDTYDIPQSLEEFEQILSQFINVHDITGEQ